MISYEQQNKLDPGRLQKDPSPKYEKYEVIIMWYFFPSKSQ